MSNLSMTLGHLCDHINLKWFRKHFLKLNRDKKWKLHELRP